MGKEKAPLESGGFYSWHIAGRFSLGEIDGYEELALGAIVKGRRGNPWGEEPQGLLTQIRRVGARTH